MYVCICHSVTDRQICQAAANGATTLDDLRHGLKVATNCGRCADCALAVLDEARRSCGEAGDPFAGFAGATAAFA